MKRALALMGVLMLAGCNDRPGPNSSICTPFPAQANNNAGATSTTVVAPGAAAPGAAGAPTVTVTAAAGMEDCLHRWGYRLAGSPDPAPLVARAAVAACGESLSAWNVQAAGEAQAAQSMDLFSGQPTTSAAQHVQFAENRALFYVVQARAGHCAVPAQSAAR